MDIEDTLEYLFTSPIQSFKNGFDKGFNDGNISDQN